jgi:Zn-dependent peptidase ImmA (M78 family)/transcriptional regulator with XRE-family HTH domain
MANTTPLTINPKVLKWAREESGYTVLQLITKLNIDEAEYSRWENTGNGIPFPALRVIAKILKRQIAVFFLPQTPQKVKRPTDFRNLTSSKSHLSCNSMLAIRRVGKFREILTELNPIQYYETKCSWLPEFRLRFGKKLLNNSQTHDSLRDLLAYSLDRQVNENNLTETYKSLRNAFEERLGIYVFQLSMPVNEIQGFSYSDTYPYCITINSKYPTSSRLFTLFHELGHILQRQSGLCIPDNVSEKQAIELECNSFAGSFLAPDNAIRFAGSKEEIFRLATKLKVSSEVYLRRQKTLNLVSDTDFLRLLEEIRNSVKSTSFGVLSPLERSRNSRGQALFNSILDALNKNLISYIRASDILGIKINHIVNV